MTQTSDENSGSSADAGWVQPVRRNISALGSNLLSWEGFLAFLLVCVVGLNIYNSESFLSAGNLINLFMLSIEKVIVVLIMAFIIMNAEIDLSVASMMGLSACALGWMVQQGVPMSAALVLSLAIGVLGGVFNGFWITVVGLPSLVVTLAMLIGFRGLARVIVEDRSIKAFPEWFENLGQQPLIGPFPFALILFFVLLVIAVIVLSYSGFGRKVRIIGISQDVARYSGIDVARVKMLLFATSGFLSASCRSTFRCAARNRPRRHGAWIRTRYNHHCSARRSQHLRRNRFHVWRDPFDIHRAVLAEWHGAEQHHGPHSDGRHRHHFDIIRNDSEYSK